MNEEPIVKVENQILFKDMLENFNENVIIEVNSTDSGLIICDDFIKLSRLFEAASNTVIQQEIRLYAQRKNIGDDLSNPLKSYVLMPSTTITENELVLKFEEILNPPEFESAVVFSEKNTPLLIINDVKQLKANLALADYSLRIYYA